VIEQFLSAADATRAARTLEKLARHDVTAWALTGGFAAEIHHLRAGRAPLQRSLNDIDFITDSFESIPATLAGDFLFRHVHPLDPPGKTILQAADPETAVRVDVFHAFGATMQRAARVELPGGNFQLISLADLTARAARLALDLAENVPTPAKYARDFLRLADLIAPASVEDAWQDQRKEKHPRTFTEARTLLHDLIPRSTHLLIIPVYSQDSCEICTRCAPTGAFHLAEPGTIQALLGYC
jgi:hypothetical protein